MNTNRRSFQRQRGAIAVMAALSLLVLIAMAGLVIDSGRLFVVKAELQGAADACALSAARELDGRSDSLQRAVNAGIHVAVRNDVDLQRNAVEAPPSSVTFSAQLAGPYAPAGAISPGTVRYVKCAPTAVSANMWFMRAVGIVSRTVTGEAVARLSASQAGCAIPVGLCTTQSDRDTPQANWGFSTGSWYQGLFEPSGTMTGNYNWIDFTPPQGGANELMDLIARTGTCNVPAQGNVGQSGYNAGLVDAWNTRFGLYKGSYTITQNPPDWTGFAYTKNSWPKMAHAYADFVAKRAAAQPYQGPSTGLAIPGSPFSTSSADHAQYGSDRRLAVVPVVRCSDWQSGQTVPIRDWACVLLLNPVGTPSDVQVEYIGPASAQNSPCVSVGLPGGANSSGPLVPTLVN
jgi:Flp pilus assembly protein TadG